MKHETEKIKSFSIVDGMYTFKEIKDLSYSPKDMLDNIVNADIVLMPYQNFRDGYDVLFPEETMKLFEYIQEECKNQDLNVDICISDEDYKEIELHSHVINISDILVKSFIVPVAINLISSYLFKKLENLNRKDVSTNVRVTIEQNGESKTVHYEGSVDNFEKTMKSINENLFN